MKYGYSCSLLILVPWSAAAKFTTQYGIQPYNIRSAIPRKSFVRRWRESYFHIDVDYILHKYFVGILCRLINISGCFIYEVSINANEKRRSKLPLIAARTNPLRCGIVSNSILLPTESPIPFSNMVSIEILERRKSKRSKKFQS